MSARDRGESDLPSEKRMTLGEHLDELRGCVIRSIIALVLAALICIFPAKYLLAIIVRPLVLAMRANNQPDSLLATSPVETIVVYVKVVVLFAVVLAGPYVIYQIWHFVAVGLYPKEKAWVYRLFPTSLALFVTGVAFMYVFALLLALNFLVGFGTWLPLPQAHPTVFERTLLGTPAAHAPENVPDRTDWPDVPLVVDDPPESPVGTMWFNLEEKRLKVRTGDETYSYQFQRDDKRAMVTPHFKIGDYLSFVLVLTLAFGIAFQLPIVVVFLARTGIVPVATFRKYRKGVILLIVFIAGMLAPPDLLSHLLLSGPMVLLFEIGLRIADRQNRRQQAGNPRPKQPA